MNQIQKTSIISIVPGAREGSTKPVPNERIIARQSALKNAIAFISAMESAEDDIELALSDNEFQETLMVPLFYKGDTASGVLGLSNEAFLLQLQIDVSEAFVGFNPGYSKPEMQEAISHKYFADFQLFSSLKELWKVEMRSYQLEGLNQIEVSRFEFYKDIVIEALGDRICDFTIASNSDVSEEILDLAAQPHTETPEPTIEFDIIADSSVDEIIASLDPNDTDTTTEETTEDVVLEDDDFVEEVQETIPLFVEDIVGEVTSPTEVEELPAFDENALSPADTGPAIEVVPRVIVTTSSFEPAVVLNSITIGGVTAVADGFVRDAPLAKDKFYNGPKRKTDAYNISDLKTRARHQQAENLLRATTKGGSEFRPKGKHHKSLATSLTEGFFTYDAIDASKVTDKSPIIAYPAGFLVSDFFKTKEKGSATVKTLAGGKCFVCSKGGRIGTASRNAQNFQQGFLWPERRDVRSGLIVPAPILMTKMTTYNHRGEIRACLDGHNPATFEVIEDFELIRADTDLITMAAIRKSYMRIGLYRGPGGIIYEVIVSK